MTDKCLVGRHKPPRRRSGVRRTGLIYSAMFITISRVHLATPLIFFSANSLGASQPPIKTLNGTAAHLPLAINNSPDQCRIVPASQSVNPNGKKWMIKTTGAVKTGRLGLCEQATVSYSSFRLTALMPPKKSGRCKKAGSAQGFLIYENFIER